jgi:hypothetical protein
MDSGELVPQAQPAALVQTFLIADIRGYSTYTQERGDEAGGPTGCELRGDCQ